MAALVLVTLAVAIELFLERVDSLLGWAVVRS